MQAPLLLAAMVLAGTPAMTQALKQYDALEYERALASLKKAETEAVTLDDRVLVQLYLGLTNAELGRTGGAETAFQNALVLDPTANLPVKTSPKTEKLFKKVKARFANVAPPKKDAPQKAEVEAPPPSDKPVVLKEEPKVAVAEPAVQAATEPKVEASGAGPLPWFLAGGGVVAVGGGVALGLASRSSTAAARAEPIQTEAARLNDEARTRAYAADALYVTSGALLAAGVAAYLLLSE